MSKRVTGATGLGEQGVEARGLARLELLVELEDPIGDADPDRVGLVIELDVGALEHLSKRVEQENTPVEAKGAGPSGTSSPLPRRRRPCPACRARRGRRRRPCTSGTRAAGDQLGARVLFFLARQPVLLPLGDGGQEHLRLDVRQRRRHHQVLAGDVDAHGPHHGQVLEKLLGDEPDGDVEDVELVLLDQVQQEVERALEARGGDVDAVLPLERRRAGRALPLRTLGRPVGGSGARCFGWASPGAGVGPPPRALSGAPRAFRRSPWGGSRRWHPSAPLPKSTRFRAPRRAARARRAGLRRRACPCGRGTRATRPGTPRRAAARAPAKPGANTPIDATPSSNTSRYCPRSLGSAALSPYISEAPGMAPSAVVATGG